jgi:hypothetical protein
MPTSQAALTIPIPAVSGIPIDEAVADNRTPWRQPDFRVLIFFQAVFWGVIAREAFILQHRGLKNPNYSH